MSPGTRATPRTVAALLAPALAAALLAGCGKGGQATSTSRRAPSSSTSPEAPRLGTVATVTGSTTRLAGAGAVQDAAAVAATVYPGLTRATRPQAVVLVESSDWADALAASELAGAPLHAPLLYGSARRVPAATAAALARMRP
ncbi:MAG: hypothetical protein ACYCYN_03990, partial [Solirubrobacteraceae bacterium]